MASRERRERDRAQRHQLIVTAARELAESEGWEAVTTRRLSERIEYSQPVLYQHFDGKDAIVRAVALEGFDELAAELRAAGPDPYAVARAYMDFAQERPRLYDALFVLGTDLPFGKADTPAPLRAAFAAIYEAIAPLAGDRDPGILTEVVWASLHGIITLSRGGRLPDGAEEQRLAILMKGLLGAVGEAHSPPIDARPVGRPGDHPAHERIRDSGMERRTGRPAAGLTWKP